LIRFTRSGRVIRLGVRPGIPTAATRFEFCEGQLSCSDRHESAGVKLNDADLLGMPLRVVISPKTLDTGSMEVIYRFDPDSGNMDKSVFKHHDSCRWSKNLEKSDGTLCLSLIRAGLRL